MKRTFVINLLLLLLLNLLVKPFWIFGIDRVVQMEVGEETYGMYYALFNFSFLFSIALDAGITNFNNKHIAQHSHMLQKHFSWMLSTKLMLGLVYAFITLIAASLLGYSSQVLPLLGWLMLNQFLASLILYLRSNISGLLLFKQDSLLSVLDRILMIIIVGFLLYARTSNQPFDIMWFVFAQTAAYAITALIALILVRCQVTGVSLKWKPIISLAILKQSFPFAMLVLLMTLYNRTDAIMIERILPDGAFQAGVYAKGYRLLDALNNIAYLFAALLLPIFSRLAIEKKSADEVIKTAQNILLPAAVFIAFFCWQFKIEITDMLYPQATVETYRVFGWLMLGFVAVAFNYIHGTLLTAHHCLKWLNWMAVFALCLNIVLNLSLIPVYGAVGAAIATIVTQFFTLLVQAWLVRKGRFHHFKPVFFLKLMVFLCLLKGLLMWLRHAWEFETHIQMTIAVFAAILMAWVFKFIQLKQLKSLVKGHVA